MHPLQAHVGQTTSPPALGYITWGIYLIEFINSISLGEETQRRSNFPYKVIQPVLQLVQQDTQLIQLVTGKARININKAKSFLMPKPVG